MIMNLDKNNAAKINLEELVSKLKAEDTRYSRLTRGLLISYLILIPIYSITILVDVLQTGDLTGLAESICFVISFVIFALVMRNLYKEYKNVNYSLSIIKMLKEAAKRYQPFRFKTLWAILAVLFMVTGIFLNPSISVVSRFIVIGLFIVAIIVGLTIWFIKYKPLRDKALILINELEKE